ncbi:MAG TPA: HAD hydrolase family protein, partial [Candidatus Paceibacterota bacterium]|nr:HAD hydrolase family protein [Candidatus Paceibacterota bacterium]
ERRYITAVTGDGVNDIPAVKAAHIGIAVHNAVDALKSAADVVLLSSGIGVIKDAFIEARKVFMRMYSYSIYRISESFRLIMTVLILGVMIHQYPLTPMQLILVAFLNDIPIISLAFNRVTYTVRPEGVPVRKRFKISLLFGIIGVLQSIILFVILRHFGYPLAVIQTAFFLKLIISGHMLVFVAHTQKRWWRFFPSRPVILATLATSILASLVASFGIFMTALSTTLLGFVWLWALGWMQISELAKGVFYAHDAKTHPELTPVAA